MIVHSKAVAELFELQVQLIEPYPLAHWFFYLELVLLSVTGIFWLYRMNQSLGLYDPLFIIPLLQSSYILFGVISGGIFFEEFAGLHNGPAGMGGWPLFVLGMLSILSGLYLIAPRTEEPAPSPHGMRPKNIRISRREEDAEADDEAHDEAADPYGAAPRLPTPPQREITQAERAIELRAERAVERAAHRRVGSKGKGSISLTALSPMPRPSGPEGTALVGGAPSSDTVGGSYSASRHQRSPSRSKTNVAALDEVTLSLAETSEEGMAPVAEDLVAAAELPAGRYAGLRIDAPTANGLESSTASTPSHSANKKPSPSPMPTSPAAAPSPANRPVVAPTPSLPTPCSSPPPSQQPLTPPPQLSGGITPGDSGRSSGPPSGRSPLSGPSPLSRSASSDTAERPTDPASVFTRPAITPTNAASRPPSSSRPNRPGQRGHQLD